jgi:glycosyltransferase involved in cell wall biosynthesis
MDNDDFGLLDRCFLRGIGRNVPSISTCTSTWTTIAHTAPWGKNRLAYDMKKKCPLSVLIPTKNEERNLPECLDSVAGWADEIVLVDSQSTDSTLHIASSYGIEVLQFHYQGGWPRKRQWALDTYDWRNDWILLLDADEILLPEIKEEIESVISRNEQDGYWICFRVDFLGRMLQHGGTALWKLSLFRRGLGRYEQRLAEQDISMGDMEIHEHVVVAGSTGRLKNAILHRNINELDRYIEKHNQYSNWEAKLLFTGSSGEIMPHVSGNQAQRRRWLKRHFLWLPGSPIASFLLRYVFQLGFLDGRPGLIYAAFQAIQLFYAKAKLYEMTLIQRKGGTDTFSGLP